MVAQNWRCLVDLISIRLGTDGSTWRFHSAATCGKRVQKKKKRKRERRPGQVKKVSRISRRWSICQRRIRRNAEGVRAEGKRRRIRLRLISDVQRAAKCFAGSRRTCKARRPPRRPPRPRLSSLRRYSRFHWFAIGYDRTTGWQQANNLIIESICKNTSRKYYVHPGR